jgi:two-component system response regulator PilR (NtrC family)
MWDPWAETRASDELRGRLKWFLFGRVIVVSCFLAMFGVSFLRGGDRYAFSFHWLLGVVVVTYGVSIVSALLVAEIERLVLFTHVQIAFDILLITGVVHITGGVDSPFPFLYSLPIINSAILLFGNGAMISALLAAAAYDALTFALTSGLIASASTFPPSHPDLQLGLRLVTTDCTFILIAYLSGILTSRLATAERLLAEKQIERDRLYVLQETLAQTTGSGLITTDPTGHITSIDRVAREWVDPQTPEVTGSDIGDLFPPLKLTASARLRILQTGAAAEPIEFVHRDGDGERHLRCSAAPLRDTYGHGIGALYVLQDVTKLKELAETAAAPQELEDLIRDDLDEAAEIAEVTDGLYGVSPVMRRVREMIDKVAGSDATILISGESGTGKEVVARAIHSHGPRGNKPFIAINCGAIPEHLIESELFGHVRGAFTGAVSDRPGCFRVADGGTLFLDEIGELPLHLQVKLLRVLQERVFRPVGSESSVAVDVRIIAASNRDLQAEVKEGRFREDLFYRLNVITFELPPLRDRREDIPLLIRHFLRQFSELHGRRVVRFSVAASRVLLQHRFSGNVRELENIVEHAVALCDDETATEEHLPGYVLNGGGRPRLMPEPEPVETAPLPVNDWLPRPPSPPLHTGTVDLERDLAEYEKAILVRALDQAGGVKKRAAELLGINYRSLRHRLQKYGLSDPNDEPVTVQ